MSWEWNQRSLGESGEEGNSGYECRPRSYMDPACSHSTTAPRSVTLSERLLTLCLSFSFYKIEPASNKNGRED